MHDFEPFLEHDATEVVFIFGAHCNEQPIKFRAFVSIVHAPMTEGHVTHGEVCYGEMVYHNIYIDRALLSGKSSLFTCLSPAACGRAASAPVVSAGSSADSSADSSAGSHGRRLAETMRTRTQDAHVRGLALRGLLPGQARSPRENAITRANPDDHHRNGRSLQGKGKGTGVAVETSDSSARPEDEESGVHVRLRITKAVGSASMRIEPRRSSSHLPSSLCVAWRPPHHHARAAPLPPCAPPVPLTVVRRVGLALGTDMNLMVALNDKPLRLVPPYTAVATDDHVVEEIICYVSDYWHNSSVRTDPFKYYLAVDGGTACSHYEIVTETFTTSCWEAQQAALKPAAVSNTYDASGGRECKPTAESCELSMRHFMRGHCTVGARLAPFSLSMPFYEGHMMDNLVIEVEMLEELDNPTALTVNLYLGTGSHADLENENNRRTQLLGSTSMSRKRIFSYGLSAIEMTDYFCGDRCSKDGTALMSIVVRCNEIPVSYRIIAIPTPLELDTGVPLHGEVCPSNWIYHHVAIADTAIAHQAYGVRFHLHVHVGDVSYLISRWKHTPGFSACNAHEVSTSGATDATVDLCHLSERFVLHAAESGAAISSSHGSDSGSSSRRRELAGAASGSASGSSAPDELLRRNGRPIEVLSDTVEEGYIGLYGGAACAIYTIEVEFLINTTCNEAVWAECTHDNVD